MVISQSYTIDHILVHFPHSCTFCKSQYDVMAIKMTLAYYAQLIIICPTPILTFFCSIEVSYSFNCFVIWRKTSLSEEHEFLLSDFKDDKMPKEEIVFLCYFWIHITFLVMFNTAFIFLAICDQILVIDFWFSYYFSLWSVIWYLFSLWSDFDVCEVY